MEVVILRKDNMSNSMVELGMSLTKICLRVYCIVHQSYVFIDFRYCISINYGQVIIPVIITIKISPVSQMCSNCSITLRSMWISFPLTKEQRVESLIVKLLTNFFVDIK